MLKAFMFEVVPTSAAPTSVAAEMAEVTNGHLVLYGLDGLIVQAWAPGSWSSFTRGAQVRPTASRIVEAA